MFRTLVTVLAVIAISSAPMVASAAPGERGHSAPGTVSSVEVLPKDLWVPGTAEAYRLTYWTVGSFGTPASSTGAVYIPEGLVPNGGWPVISWAHGTVGLGDNCTPSRLPKTDRDRVYLSHWMSQGYAVVASDYAGLGTEGLHTYLEGAVAARSVIDMVRAGRQVAPQLSSKWVVIGQSQGGHAALFAAHQATRYAPELDYRGAVTTGAPSNLDQLYPFGGPNFPDLGLDGLNVFTTYIFASLRAARPDFDIESYLSPLGRELINSAETLCYDDQAAKVAGIPVGALLNQSLDDDEFRRVLTGYLGVPSDGYDRPLYIAQGLADTVVPAPLSFKLAADLRVSGADALYKTYPTDHDRTMAASLPDTTPFVSRLMQ